MGFISKDKINIPRINAGETAQKGSEATMKLLPGLGAAFTEGARLAGDAASTAATETLDLNIAQMPRIREAQKQFNQELFGGVERQEALSADLMDRAQANLGKGITFDEERALREQSRGAFTSRGRFGDTASIFDELTRRLDAEQARRLQNFQVAQGALASSQIPIQNRQALFLDPRSAVFTPQQVLQTGLGIGQTAFGAGVGLASSAAQTNFEAGAAEAAANRRGGIGGKILKGIGQAGISFLGGGGASSLGGLFKSDKGGLSFGGAIGSQQAQDMGGLGGTGFNPTAGFSDRRLKRNIQKIGSDPRGFGVYQWEYVWGGPTQTGVMADELEAIIPEAVSRHKSGYLMVDYSKI